MLFWILSAIGLIALVVFGTVGRRSALRAHEEGVSSLWAPRFRFHPLTLVLGLFLTYFGTVFLFNASVTGDDTPAGFVAFVYLNYAGIVRRGVISILSLGILLLGLWMLTTLSFKPGLGLQPRRAQGPYEPQRIEPAPAPPVADPRPEPAPAQRPAVVRARPTSAGADSRRRAPTSAAPGVRRPRAPSTSRSS